MTRPLQFHPMVRAALLQLARKLRFDGCRIRREIDTLEAVHAFKAVMPAADLLELWRLERQAAFEWCSYAAAILEAGAGWAAGDRTAIW